MDALNDENPWACENCMFSRQISSKRVGFPAYCGPTSYSDNEWTSLKTPMSRMNYRYSTTNY